MKRLVSLLIWLLAFALSFCAFPVTTRAEEIVSTTKYSCQPHPDNAMTNTPGFCEVTFSGREPDTRGAACPAEWLGSWVWVAGEGTFLCDDLSSRSHSTLAGYRHVDVRTTSYEEAAQFGIQQRRAKRLGASYREPLNLSAKRGRGPY